MDDAVDGGFVTGVATDGNGGAARFQLIDGPTDGLLIRDRVGQFTEKGRQARNGRGELFYGNLPGQPPVPGGMDRLMLACTCESLRFQD
ncbi:MAG: hypothetical protein ACRDTT_03345 [Pseudonocardiaceae bacterium]